MPDTPKNPIQATKKTIQIIEALRSADGAGITELANKLQYSKSTIHHYLTTLEDTGFVVKENKRYRLGIHLFELGEYVRQQNDVYEVAKKEIDELAMETGELANLMVEENGRGVYLYIAESERAINLDTTIGTAQYLHSCAIGKAILAEMSPARRDEILNRHGLPATTPNTITDRTKLEEEIEKIRESGVAFDDEERAEAIRCVATAVTDKDRRLLGAISVSGPSSRISGERFREEIPERVRNTAEIIGINSSYP